ncbi:MAG: YggS family pyridoxal phosphate-dependent enzyme [Planctomycetes bacterium]|nr:YggS family pyridoxal phosphate-dependent enzyme [Planctomycetota bacterium]
MAGEGPRADARALVAGNVKTVLSAIRESARRAGRDPGSILLVAATKYVGASGVRLLWEMGIAVFGENRVAAAIEKAREIGPGPRWHLIGHLQRNKVAKAIDAFEMIQSLDSVRLAEEMQRRLILEERPPMPVLLEINIAREPRKTGFAPDEAAKALDEIARLDRIEVRGLMTMGPATGDSEAMRPHFRALRRLREDLRAAGIVPGGLPELSMGMSADYAVAVEEGATMVRVGSALLRGVPRESLA